MAKSDEAKSETIDAVAIGLTMHLTPEVVAKYACDKWVGCKMGNESVDASGQRWVTVSMPIGPRTHTHRSDTVIAIAMVKQPDGYSVVRLELPLKVAAQFAAETSDPEPRGFAVDQAQRKIAELAER